MAIWFSRDGPPMAAAWFTATLGYLARHATGDDTAVTIFGATNALAPGGTDTGSPYAGMAFDFHLPAGHKLRLEGRGYFGSDLTGIEAMARYSAVF